jgi:hypothetical protein
MGFKPFRIMNDISRSGTGVISALNKLFRLKSSGRCSSFEWLTWSIFQVRRLHKNRRFVRFEVFTTITMKIVVFMDVVPCNLLDIYQCFRETCSFRLQGRRRSSSETWVNVGQISRHNIPKESTLDTELVYYLLLSCLYPLSPPSWSSTLLVLFILFVCPRLLPLFIVLICILTPTSQL